MRKHWRRRRGGPFDCDRRRRKSPRRRNGDARYIYLCSFFPVQLASSVGHVITIIIIIIVCRTCPAYEMNFFSVALRRHAFSDGRNFNGRRARISGSRRRCITGRLAGGDHLKRRPKALRHDDDITFFKRNTIIKTDKKYYLFLLRARLTPRHEFMSLAPNPCNLYIKTCTHASLDEYTRHYIIIAVSTTGRSEIVKIPKR